METELIFGVPDPVIEAQKTDNMPPKQGLYELTNPCSLPKLTFSQCTFKEIMKVVLLPFLHVITKNQFGSLYVSLDVLELAM